MRKRGEVGYHTKTYDLTVLPGGCLSRRVRAKVADRVRVGLLKKILPYVFDDGRVIKNISELFRDWYSHEAYGAALKWLAKNHPESRGTLDNWLSDAEVVLWLWSVADHEEEKKIIKRTVEWVEEHLKKIEEDFKMPLDDLLDKIECDKN